MTANASRAMLPLQSLLNPSSSDPTTPRHRSSHATILSPSDSDATETSSSTMDVAVASGGRRPNIPSIVAKARPRGPVNYYPFENLDGPALQAVRKFQVTPFGQIHKGFQHIPYSSTKKDLFEKTGRESIEAFKYEFRVPGQDRIYVVMWDYNIGIVRMNPFIKWGGFPKTKSSQMLDKNPGLRNISPGITGGAVSAQGYWVPYRCARALCATFCHPIAGALIPLFGPSFPTECTHPESPAYNEMLVSRALLAEDARQADITRRYNTNRTLAARNGVTSHPRPESYPFCDSAGHSSATYLQPVILDETAWPVSGTPAGYRTSPKQIATSGSHGLHEYKIASHAGTRFTPANLPSPEEDPFERADPYLSAMPQRQALARSRPPDAPAEAPWAAKRRRLSHQRPPHRRENTAPQLGSPSSGGGASAGDAREESPPRTLAHYNAAMVLVALSSKKKGAGAAAGPDHAPEHDDPPRVADDGGHQTKRQRARSF